MGLKAWINRKHLTDPVTFLVFGEIAYLYLFAYGLEKIEATGFQFIVGIISVMVSLAWMNSAILLLGWGDQNGT